jgi:hypothetical protein
LRRQWCSADFIFLLERVIGSGTGGVPILLADDGEPVVVLDMRYGDFYEHRVRFGSMHGDSCICWLGNV